MKLITLIACTLSIITTPSSFAVTYDRPYKPDANDIQATPPPWSNQNEDQSQTDEAAPLVRGGGPGLPPRGNDPNLPPRGNNPNLPARGNDPNLAPRGNNPNLPARGNDPNLAPRGNNPNLPPRGNDLTLPPRGNE
ncbi:MAG: hypothetical protein AB7I18_01675 [Candidatus Berkiella sp.]